MSVRPRVNREMRLNDAGEIARRCWEDIPHHFPRVVLDAVMVMPNHVHGVIVIREYILTNPARWSEDENNPVLLNPKP